MQVSSVNVYISKSPHREGILCPKLPSAYGVEIESLCWTEERTRHHDKKKRQHRRERENESDAGVGIFPVEK